MEERRKGFDDTNMEEEFLKAVERGRKNRGKKIVLPKDTPESIRKYYEKRGKIKKEK